MSTDEIKTFDISLLQLSDSFFPTGMYTTSSGLEWLYYQKKIKDPDALFELLKVYIEHQMGPADCSALGNAYDYASKSDVQSIVEVDHTIHAMKVIDEVRTASSRSGTQLLRCIASFVTDNGILNQYMESVKNGQATGAYPVALGVAGVIFGIPKKKMGLSMLYGFSVSVVGAALRLGMLQHFDAQRIIHDLKPIMIESVNRNIDRSLNSMWQFAPEADIIQISHEQISSKMFIT